MYLLGIGLHDTYCNYCILQGTLKRYIEWDVYNTDLGGCHSVACNGLYFSQWLRNWSIMLKCGALVSWLSFCSDEKLISLRTWSVMHITQLNSAILTFGALYTSHVRNITEMCINEWANVYHIKSHMYCHMVTNIIHKFKEHRSIIPCSLVDRQSHWPWGIRNDFFAFLNTGVEDTNHTLGMDVRVVMPCLWCVCT
jgi:hypothetical protein